MTRLERSALLEAPAALAFEVVADVERYPEFLPGCEAVTVLESSPAGLVAEVAVAGRGIHESFVTANEHRPGEAIVMSLKEGPFERLEGEWLFTQLGELGCRVDITIEFVPKGIVARILSGFADRLANRVVDAFSERIICLAAQPVSPDAG